MLNLLIKFRNYKQKGVRNSLESLVQKHFRQIQNILLQTRHLEIPKNRERFSG